MEHKKRRILFHCHHLSCLYQFVWLRAAAHPEDAVLLLVNHRSFGESAFARNLARDHVFDRILTVQEPKDFREKQGEALILQHYDAYFQRNGLSLDAFEEIYTACDLNNLFPIYCILHGKGFSYLEMYPGQFADPSRYRAGTERFGYPGWWSELEWTYRSLTGDGGGYTVRRYLWKGSRCEYPGKDLSVDFLQKFYSLPPPWKERVVRCLGLPEYLDGKEWELFLLNSLKWSREITGLEGPDHYAPYLLLLDYLFDGRRNVLVKDHPHTEAEPYFQKLVAPRAGVLAAAVPIEFYGLAQEFRIGRLISVQSSGNGKIAPFVREETQLGSVFLEQYPLLHRIALCCSIMKQTDRQPSFRTAGLSRNLVQTVLTHFTVFHWEDGQGKTEDSLSVQHQYLLAGDEESGGWSAFPSYRELPDEAILVFLDHEGMLRYWKRQPDEEARRDLVRHTAPLLLEKRTGRETVFLDRGQEWLFFVSKDRRFLRRIQALQGERILAYTGLHLRVSGNGPECRAMKRRLQEPCSDLARKKGEFP